MNYGRMISINIRTYLFSILPINPGRIMIRKLKIRIIPNIMHLFPLSIHACIFSEAMVIISIKIKYLKNNGWMTIGNQFLMKEKFFPAISAVPDSKTKIRYSFLEDAETRKVNKS